MAEVAIVHKAVRTSTGLETFTVSGFGTPKAALFIITGGTVDGTAVTHAFMGIGATDGTLQNNIAGSSKDAVVLGSTNCHSWAGTANCIGLCDPASAGGAILWRASFDSWITDGVQVNVAVTDGVAYLVTCILFGGTGISNAYVNTVTGSAINGGTVVVSSLTFQPDFLITWGRPNTGRPFDNFATYNQNDLSLGFVQRGASNPHQEKSLWFEEFHASNPTDMREQMAMGSAFGQVNAQPYLTTTDFTSVGFTMTTNNAAASIVMGYLAVKLNGISCKVLEFDSPTSGGSQDITGIGFTPQFGLTLMSAQTSINATSSDEKGEVFGVGAFTTPTQVCNMINSDDAVTTTISKSLTHSRPVFLRKDAATFMDATFTSFGSGTATFNYGTADGTARKWAGLFIQAQSGAISDPLTGKLGGLLEGHKL